MPRDFQIFGPAIIGVTFGAHVPTVISGQSITASGVFSGQGSVSESTFSELGLTEGPINIKVNFRHKDIKTEAFGPDIPIDQQFMLADAFINTRLIHYDPNILELCLREATAGGADPTSSTEPAGTLGLAGSVMGGGRASAVPGTPFVPESGYHFISLNILSSLPKALPWRFPASFLTGPPVVIPLGTEKSIVDCTWRAIPYSISFTNPVEISGGYGTIFVGPKGSTQTTGLNITTVVETTDPSRIGLTGKIFLWDHTSDIPSP